MAEMQTQNQQQGTFAATPELGLLDKIVEEGRFGRDAAAKERGVTVSQGDSPSVVHAFRAVDGQERSHK